MWHCPMVKRRMVWNWWELGPLPIMWKLKAPALLSSLRINRTLMGICLQGSFKAPTALMNPMINLLDRHCPYASSPPMGVTLSVLGHGMHSLKLQIFLNDAAFEDSPTGAI